MSKVSAYTKRGVDYPGYVNVTETDDDSVVITVRSDATVVQGARLCGVTCHPGGMFCNNYCNHRPGEPMPDHPLPHTFYREGDTVSLTLTKDEWRELLAEIISPKAAQ